MTRVYLDHASTSPLRPEARDAMRVVLDQLGACDFGDPSRLHQEGMAARSWLESCRDRVAFHLGARPREVVFVSGATEAIALAMHHCAGLGKMAIGAIEHASVRSHTSDPVVLPVDCQGIVSLPSNLDDTVRSAHLQHTNHETGTRQPIEAFSAWGRERNLVTHVDAAQTLGWEPIDFHAWDTDLVSLSGHKSGGPAGVGVLLVRRGIRVNPIISGGDQERARRGGLENLIGIAGFAAALDAIHRTRIDETSTATRCNRMIRDWAATRADVTPAVDAEHAAPTILCLVLSGVEPQPVLIGLDRKGVAVHSGSSCSAEAFEPSPVLRALGVDAERSLRVSFGWNTTEADAARFIACADEILDELQTLRR